jgi:hypothetical protein
MRPKHVAVTEKNIQTCVALDENPEPDRANVVSLNTNIGLNTQIMRLNKINGIV